MSTNPLALSVLANIVNHFEESEIWETFELLIDEGEITEEGLTAFRTTFPSLMSEEMYDDLLEQLTQE